MPRTRTEDEIVAIADEVLELLGTGKQVSPFSSRWNEFTMDDGYAAGARGAKKRAARGERPVGRKIGFTNKAAWGGLGISAPMWGPIYSTTVRDLTEIGHSFPLDGFAEPRIEPEIIVGLSKTPRPGMSDAELRLCIDWVAQGFEIAQCIYPGWRFTVPDAIADYCLHAALLIGERLAPSAELIESLPKISVELLRGDEVKATGRGADVLGGPLSSLRSLMELLASDPTFEPLRAGEIVTTGTMSPAPPIAAGEIWSARLSNTPLVGAHVTFA